MAAFDDIEALVEGESRFAFQQLYDVFISHRGPDVKLTLASQLYRSLQMKRYQAFLDSEEIKGGDHISLIIYNAICSASVQIVILSRGFAKSSYCLDELLLMLQQTKALFIPVFYDVKPSELRYIEKGVYAEAFSEYERKGRYLDKLDDWKRALHDAAGISGYELTKYKEGLCDAIVSAVVERMEPRRPWELRYIEDRAYAEAFSKYDRKGRKLDKLDCWKISLCRALDISGSKPIFGLDLCDAIIPAAKKWIEAGRPLQITKYPVGQDECISDFEPVNDFETYCQDKGLTPSELYGKFTWKIEKFSQISRRELRSSVFELGGCKWYILMYPQGCDVFNYLSIFLCVADYDKLLPGLSRFAFFTIAIVNKDAKKSRYSDAVHRFCKKEHDWGWKKFMEVSKVLDEYTIADTLVIKAQVQVIRENPHRPFRCLDDQYRRELLRVYITKVESICRRFWEETQEKLGKLKEDTVQWSSLYTFWLAVDEDEQRRMSREKTDVILKQLVIHFFNENEPTSILVMDALYSGYKALKCQSANNKGKNRNMELEDISSPVVCVEKDAFVLADDALSLLKRAATEPLLPLKDDKGPQNHTKDRSSIEDFGGDSVDWDEKCLTELGRRTVEMFVLTYIYSKHVEMPYQRDVSIETSKCKKSSFVMRRRQPTLKWSRGQSPKQLTKKNNDCKDIFFTELGRRTAEIFALAEQRSNRVKMVYQRDVSIEMQDLIREEKGPRRAEIVSSKMLEDLIREEKAASHAEIEPMAKREAADKDK